MLNELKATVFVYLVRPYLKPNESGIRDCPCCGELLSYYDEQGWLHMQDGDADCYGALGYGKGSKCA